MASSTAMNTLNLSNAQNSNSNSRILHNNWIIDNQMIADHKKKTAASSCTNKGSNKSVIIVKPNHVTNSSNNENGASRTSLRKSNASERKE